MEFSHFFEGLRDQRGIFSFLRRAQGPKRNFLILSIGSGTEKEFSHSLNRLRDRKGISLSMIFIEY